MDRATIQDKIDLIFYRKSEFSLWEDGIIYSKDYFATKMDELKTRLKNVSPGPVLFELGSKPRDVFYLLALLYLKFKPIIVTTENPIEMRVRYFEKYCIPYFYLGSLVDPEKKEINYSPLNCDSFLLCLTTSGSTGEPKVIAASSESLTHGIIAINKAQGLDAVKSTGQFLPLYYSYAFVNQLLWAVYYEKRLDLTQGMVNPVVTLSKLREVQSEMICMVAPHIRILHKLGMIQEKYCLNSVKVVNFAGGPFPLDRLDEIEFLFPNGEIYNNYGCTEALPRVAIGNVKRGNIESTKVGPPIESVNVCVRNPDEKGVGNLFIRGNSIAIGEVNEKLNVQNFSDDGWVFTGDQGYLDSKGLLHICGRIDQIAKISGERVSLLAVDNAFLSHPNISDAFSATFADEDKEKQLMVCVHLRNEMQRKDLLELLKTKLPKPAWPRSIFQVNSWLSLNNGKPDRKEMARKALQGQYPFLLKTR